METAVQLVDIESIKPNPDNPRTINKEKFRKLKQNIKSFPEMLYKRPMVVDEDGVVLGGNMRLKASRS
jgi:ParB-like chromosome segregation protein Spo0J